MFSNAAIQYLSARYIIRCCCRSGIFVMTRLVVLPAMMVSNRPATPPVLQDGSRDMGGDMNISSRTMKTPWPSHFSLPKRQEVQ